MIIVELPIVYAQNADEIAEGKNKGIEVDVIEYVDKTTFLIPDCVLVRINPSTDKGRTTIAFDEDGYQTDLDYESTILILSEAIKRGN